MTVSADSATANLLRVCAQTLTMSEFGARLLGGPDHGASARTLRKHGITETEIRERMLNAGHPPQFVDRVLEGAP